MPRLWTGDGTRGHRCWPMAAGPQVTWLRWNLVSGPRALVSPWSGRPSGWDGALATVPPCSSLTRSFLQQGPMGIEPAQDTGAEGGRPASPPPQPRPARLPAEPQSSREQPPALLGPLPPPGLPAFAGPLVPHTLYSPCNAFQHALVISSSSPFKAGNWMHFCSLGPNRGPGSQPTRG